MHEPVQEDFLIKKRGVILFFFGAILGLAYILTMFLQDTEALIFSALVSGDETLNLSCPEVITTQESSTIRARIHNPTQKTVTRTIRTDISEGYLTLKREFQDKYELTPGEHRTVQWTIYPEDAAYGYVILAKAFLFPNGPLRSKVGVCGTLVLNIPFLTGFQFTMLIFLVSGTSMAIGLSRYSRANQPLRRNKLAIARTMTAVMVGVAVGLAASFLESWYLNLAISILTIFLVAESIFHITQQ